MNSSLMRKPQELEKRKNDMRSCFSNSLPSQKFLAFLRGFQEIKSIKES